MKEIVYNDEYIKQCEQLGVNPDYSKEIEYHGWNATIILFYIADFCEKDSEEYFRSLKAGEQYEVEYVHLTKEKVKFKLKYDSDFPIDRCFTTENELISFWKSVIEDFEKRHGYVYVEMSSPL